MSDDSITWEDSARYWHGKFQEERAKLEKALRDARATLAETETALEVALKELLSFWESSYLTDGEQLELAERLEDDFADRREIAFRNFEKQETPFSSVAHHLLQSYKDDTQDTWDKAQRHFDASRLRRYTEELASLGDVWRLSEQGVFRYCFLKRCITMSS